MIINSDLETVLKRNNVVTCSYSYFKECNQASVSVILRNARTSDENKKELESYFHDKGIEQVDFSYLSQKDQKPGVVYEDLNSTLLYTNYHGVINKERFDEMCNALSGEKEIEKW